MTQLGVTTELLDRFKVMSLLQKVASKRPATTMRRSTAYPGILVQLGDMCLQTVASQAIDAFAAKADSLLGTG